MAKLYEYQCKDLLTNFGVNIPRGKVISSPDEAKKFTEELKQPVVLKVQVWTTKRASIGGIRFANTPEEAYKQASELFKLKIGNFTVEKILVEEKLKIKKEFYASIIIDDVEKKPLIIFSSIGGSGIEEIVKEHPNKVEKFYININTGLRDYQARNIVIKTGINGKLMLDLSEVLVNLWNIAKSYDARSAEINPLVLTEDGIIYAADCRISIDDYSVYKHPDLEIEIAREFDHLPTELEKIAFNVEKNDYRGTFYFIQLQTKIIPEEEYLGFHGAGGGGSMISMDAITKKGFKIANFTDTSGNPPASKVYRAAKIILSQNGIVGYFGSGSGVASQEQTNSARGLVKAFKEDNISIPVVIRLGGNREDEAVAILTKYTRELTAVIEGYKKNDSPDFCAERMRSLVNKNGKKPHKITTDFRKPIEKASYGFKTITGNIVFDYEKCKNCSSKACIDACEASILNLENGYPKLAISEEDAKKGKCTECLACELECNLNGNRGLYIDLPIPGLESYRKKYGGQ